LHFFFNPVQKKSFYGTYVATLLVVGVWYPALVLIPALLMALLMISAQYFHFKVNNPFQKRIPALFLLSLCLFVAAVSLNWIA
jgi:hypothetical protein